jgi:hypothetical protein
MCEHFLEWKRIFGRDGSDGGRLCLRWLVGLWSWQRWLLNWLPLFAVLTILVANFFWSGSVQFYQEKLIIKLVSKVVCGNEVRLKLVLRSI